MLSALACPSASWAGPSRPGTVASHRLPKEVVPAQQPLTISSLFPLPLPPGASLTLSALFSVCSTAVTQRASPCHLALLSTCFPWARARGSGRLALPHQQPGVVRPWPWDPVQVSLEVTGGPRGTPALPLLLHTLHPTAALQGLKQQDQAAMD